MDKTEQELSRFVRDHQVTWQTQPITAMEKGERVEVGFDLELLAVHGPASGSPRPGCPACHRLFLGMKKVAEVILPLGVRPSRYDIQPFDHAFHLDPAGAFEPQVALRIQILHRQNYFDPIDDCEVRCLRAIEGSLRDLGARKGKWRQGRPRDPD